MRNDMIAVRPGLQEALIGYHLRRASAVFASDYVATMADTGVRQVLFAILSVVATNPGISQGKVGTALGIQRANMVSLINELEAHGWLQRTTSPTDKRTVALNLKPDGEAIVVNCLARLGRHEDRLLAGLSGTERTLLAGLLRRLHETREATDD